MLLHYDVYRYEDYRYEIFRKSTTNLWNTQIF